MKCLKRARLVTVTARTLTKISLVLMKIIASHAEVVENMKNVVVPSPQTSSVSKVTIPASDTKSKNAMSNPKTRLNVGKCLYL